MYHQFARILGCLCLPQHDTSFHCVVLEEFSEMEDSVSLLTTLLTHATLRKRVIFTCDLQWSRQAQACYS